jgi:dephospho-CoA kinase
MPATRAPYESDLDFGVASGDYRPGVRSVGLTGGIGSGKSTVSALLAARGAVVVDADAITREVQGPGSPVVAAMVERFGSGIVDDGGALVRQAVADIVFNDPEALKDLNQIVHPAVTARMAERLAELAGTDELVILDIPLLVEGGREGLVGIIVVDVDPEVAVSRLVEHRGMREDDARARMARQASREERLARADIVIDNSGSPADLEAEVDRAWPKIVALGDQLEASDP